MEQTIAGKSGEATRAMQRRRVRDNYLHLFSGNAPIDVSGRSSLAKVALAIDWDLAPRRTLLTTHAGLGSAAPIIEEAAQDPRVADVARACRIVPVLLVVGLMARMADTYSDSATRLARRLLRRVPVEEQLALAKHLKLLSFIDV